jgi:hypothetical protein
MKSTYRFKKADGKERIERWRQVSEAVAAHSEDLLRVESWKSDSDSDDDASLWSSTPAGINTCIALMHCNVVSWNLTHCVEPQDTIYHVIKILHESDEALLQDTHGSSFLTARNLALKGSAFTFHSALSWFIESYRAKMYLWELFEFARKLFLSSVIVFLRPGSSMQILYGAYGILVLSQPMFLQVSLTPVSPFCSGIMFCTLFELLVSNFRPYNSADDDLDATLSFTSLTFTLLLGISLKLKTHAMSASPGNGTLASEQVERDVLEWSLVFVIWLLLFIIMVRIITSLANQTKEDANRLCKQCSKSSNGVVAVEPN